MGSDEINAGDHEVIAELDNVEPGKPLLLVYDSLNTLLANCGPHQAASAIQTDSIDEVARQAGAHGIAYNAVLVEAARHDATPGEEDWSINDDLYR